MNRNDYPLLADIIKSARDAIQSLDPTLCRKYEKSILLVGTWFVARAIAETLLTTRHDFDARPFYDACGLGPRLVFPPLPPMTECPLCREDYAARPSMMRAVKVNRDVPQYVCQNCLDRIADLADERRR